MAWSLEAREGLGFWGEFGRMSKVEACRESWEEGGGLLQRWGDVYGEEGKI